MLDKYYRNIKKGEPWPCKYPFDGKESDYRKALRILLDDSENSFAHEGIISAFVAIACYYSLEANEEAKKAADFDDFCGTVLSIWVDCKDRTGIASISDWVADYAAENGSLPDISFRDLAAWAEERGLS